MARLDAAARGRLEREHNVWIVSVRPDGRPHIVPVWFVWAEECFYVCVQPDSVKARNLRRDGRVALSLEDGSRPVICEGRARFMEPPWPAGIATAFRRKYDWDLSTEADYTAMVEVVPDKWLLWGPSDAPADSSGGS
ncbi:MAG: hypothetical protein A2Y93_02655 [Chloroflexi bacterium RBG_13_68_17]|nr:MAG: hypothetical protein A2Y93_02655 [Chloroflexi bacterium RBG_13_68_17]